MVRSTTPEPGAWTTFRGQRLGLGPVWPDDGRSDLAPGELAAGRAEVWVGTGGGAVRLGDVRAPGKRPMPAADWSRGVRLRPGERLGG